MRLIQSRTFLRFIGLCLLILPAKLSAQSLLDRPLSLNMQEVTCEQALDQIGSTANIALAYSSRFLDPNSKKNYRFEQTPLGEILSTVLSGTGLGVRVAGEGIAVYRLQGGQLHGYIRDQESGEALYGATVHCPALRIGVLTNEYGFYSLALPPGDWEMHLRYVGYAPQVTTIKVTEKDLQHDGSMVLQPSWEPVVITPERREIPDQPHLANKALQIEPEWVRSLPALAGEPDLVRAAHLLPGVQPGAEGAGGLQIRGGDGGHNLMLLDGVPVYIPFHLLGMYSIYNTSTVKSAQLHRGSFSARFGGRSGGILDVRTREGNRERFSAEGNISPQAVRLNAEIPLAGKGGLLLSGRFSPKAFLLNPTLDRTYFQGRFGEMESRYHDIFAKIHFDLGPKDRLFLSYFTSRDEFGKEGEESGSNRPTEETESEVYWGNTVVALRWNHQFNERMFSNTTLTGSQYNYKYTMLNRLFPTTVGESEELYYVENRSDNLDVGLRSDLNIYASERHSLRTGFEFTSRHIQPHLSYFDQDSPELDGAGFVDAAALSALSTGTRLSGLEVAVYAEDEFRVNAATVIRAGLRGSSFTREEYNFFNAEPRLLLSHRLNEKLDIFASGSRMVQYMHLISNTVIRFPNDLWLPATEGLRPQGAWIAETGAGLRLNDQWTMRLELYGKTLQNLYRVPDGFDFLGNINLEAPASYLALGEGRAFGAEATLTYQGKRQTGIFSYTRSKTERRFVGSNDGNWYPQDFDRRHQFKLNLSQAIGKHWRLGLNAFYFSGSPQLSLVEAERGLGLTQPTLNAPGTRNLQRSAPYHRVDLNISYTQTGKRFTHRLQAGVFNLYNRDNPSYYRLAAGQAQAVGVGGLPLLPSFAYTLSH